MANAKWEKMLWFVNGFQIFTEETLGSEFFGVVPSFWVHVYGMEKWDDMSIFRNSESFKFNISVKIKERQLIIIFLVCKFLKYLFLQLLAFKLKST